MPVKGIIPIIAPIFIKACKIIQELIPPATSLLNLSLQELAILKPRQKNIRKSKIKIKLPINPVSSAKIAKIESEID